MNRAEFTKSLHLGLGRAFLYARDHDVSEYRDVILDACVHCYAYDFQMEGTRADYMYELVGVLPDRDFFDDAVLESLAETADDMDTAQRFRFALCMAEDGNEHARRAMYDHYNPGPRYGESIGMNLLDLDGIPGLLFVTEKLGALVLAKPDRVDIGWVLSRSKEAIGEQVTWDALRDAGRENPQIEAYRQAADASQKPSGESFDRAEIRSMSYAEALKRVPANKSFLLWTWGEHASAEELELAARALIEAPDAEQQLRHLHTFKRRRFPGPPDMLIALAEGSSRSLGFAAMNALEHFEDLAVRQLALRLIKSDVAWRGESVDLLIKNFESGDWELALDWLESEKDPEALHSLGFGLRNLWEQHPDQNTEVRMLHSLYAKNPCSGCREFTVKRLIEIDALTEEMRVECAYDANQGIRELVSEKRTSD